MSHEKRCYRLCRGVLALGLGLILLRLGASPRAVPTAVAEEAPLQLSTEVLEKKSRVVVEIAGGGSIEGSLLKRDDERLYLYVGGEVVSIGKHKIESIKDLDGAEADLEDVQHFKLYQTGRRPVKATRELVAELGPSIVVVKTPSGLGTGWFVNGDGYLITNNHVIARERSITVTMFHKDAQRFGKKVYKKVRIIALNDDIDLALLKIEEPIEVEYPQLYLGESSVLQVGDKAFAVGNPLGLERSTSEGIISKVARSMSGRLYIQTTAPIAPGNSGGPLFNERGEVIGVVNMGYIMLDGLGFAIPSRYVKEFLDNVEAFAYDEDNPNSGVQYMETPVATRDRSVQFIHSDLLKIGHGLSSLTLGDLDGDGVEDIVFANNNKAEIGIIRRRQENNDEDAAGEVEIDVDDVNQLRDSDRFHLDTVAVRSAVSSLDVADINGDQRSDIVFYGDVDRLAVLEQKPDGTFKSARKIEDIEARERRRAVRVRDLDGNGQPEILVLGAEALTILRDGKKREELPLGKGYQSTIKRFEVMDVNADSRLDIVLFVGDENHAIIVRPQNAEGRFVEEYPVRSSLSGPVVPYKHGAGVKFLTLDKGLNRIRELSLGVEEVSGSEVELPGRLLSLPVDPRAGVAADLEVADVDGNGRPDLVAADRFKNQYVVYQNFESGFRPQRSPAPRKLTAFKVFNGKDGRVVIFSLSKADKLFGISRVDGGKVLFPRPINTEGQVELVMLQELDGVAHVVWVEKSDSDYYARLVPAAELASRVSGNEKGSLDVQAKTLNFGDDEGALSRRPSRMAWADFNADGTLDLVTYWSHSAKESLYLNIGDNQFEEIIRNQDFLEEEDGQPLLVEDVDGDNVKDVLLVQPGFVRLLRLDDKKKLYVERQFTWPFDTVKLLALHSRSDEGPRFIAYDGRQARIVRLDTDGGAFVFLDKLDLTGLDVARMKVEDIDGNGLKDVLLFGEGAVAFLLSHPERWQVSDRLVFNAKLDHFSYWNLHAADLNKDGADEVLLFDSKKAMFEIYRPDPEGQLTALFRQRIFEKSIFQKDKAAKTMVPQELAIGDVDGNGHVDFICILQDRIGIYQQGSFKGGLSGESTSPLNKE